jgi:ketosteroid isomerase-like protein
VSAQNVEVVRRSYEAFSRGDFDAALADYDPAVEWHMAEDEPDAQVHRGHDGIRRMVVAWAAPWTNRFERAVRPLEFIDRGDWVVVPLGGRLRGKHSGVEVEMEETQAALVRDGRIVRVEEFRTTEEALEAVSAKQP